MTVGIVVVSHSRALARAACRLAAGMVPDGDLRVEIAAGLDEPGLADGTLGTDADAVRQAIERADDGAGVLVICDLGSAVLSAEMAVELLEGPVQSRVVVSPAPLVEGLVAASVTAAGGATLAEVAVEAAAALSAKRAQLADPAAPETPAAPDAPAADGPEVAATFTVLNPHGLHARPAARLVSTARQFDAQVRLRKQGGPTGFASATSLSAMTLLGAEQHDVIELSATGAQAAAAREAIVALAAHAFDEGVEPDGDPAPTAEVPSVPLFDGAVGGSPVAAAPGLVLGPAFRLAARPLALPEQETGSADEQLARLDVAMDATRSDLAAAGGRVAGGDLPGTAGVDAAAIFDAHALLLDDPALLESARSQVAAGTGVARAWKQAVTAVADAFAQLSSSYQRERAADVRSVGEQVLRHLLGASAPAPEAADAAAGVVVADDLVPAQVADLDRGRVQAIVLARGSVSSHAVILARSYGIPMLTGAGGSVLDIADGTLLAVDGDLGTLVAAPSEEVVSDFRDRMARRERDAAAAHAAAVGTATTTDGVEIAVLANVASVADARAAAAAHADGSGLVRTEFLFLGRDRAPDRDEQEGVYRAIAEAFDGRRVVLRTLDAGGDKPLPFLTQAHEANPFLGVRGLRLTLRHPGLMLDQLVAMCRVAHDHPTSVMLPMVSTVAEVLAARVLFERACEEAGGRAESLRFGIMVEVPAAAVKSTVLAPHVEFFSVGTNDLTQYTLAAERGNAGVAQLADGLDPGVLAMIAALCEGAGQVPVSVCGELGADPDAVAVLIGLGVRSLSVVTPAVAGVKQRVRSVSASAARALAARALTCAGPAEVRALVAEVGPPA